MSKRLQVLFDERELAEIRRLARRRGVTVADLVREALRQEHRRSAERDPRAKLDAVRAAARCAYPTADIDRMLAEVEAGYLGRTAE
jgi:uncharacterized iron-regulated membrane protein